MPSPTRTIFKYISGFENIMKSEALPGALPMFQNAPQHTPYNLFAEILSGSAFTAPRHINKTISLYRLHPTVVHTFKNFKMIPSVDQHIEKLNNPNSNPFLDISCLGSFPSQDSYKNYYQTYLTQFFSSQYYKEQVTLWTSPPFTNTFPLPPIQMRWSALNNLPDDHKLDFFQSLITLSGHGSPLENIGGTLALYNCNQSMADKSKFMANYDAEMLIIPQEGGILIRTEMGDLTVEPLEVACIPRSVKFQVSLLPKNTSAMSTEAKENVDGGAHFQETLIDTDNKEANPSNSYKGYVCENFGSCFRLPEMGPIGINSGLAHPRHFITPVASFEDVQDTCELAVKYRGNVWTGVLPFSPLDVVAWQGNNVPYKYDLRLFNCINTVTHDHPDPSIYTVLTSPTMNPGVANMDFVIFPPRWNVAENTFRPPWFHRNYMSELMGLIVGKYDAKQEFKPGAVSIHNQMVAHGPDYKSWKIANELDTSKPVKYKGTMAFMLESLNVWQPTNLAYFATQSDGSEWRQENYPACWKELEIKQFNPTGRVKQTLPFE